MTGLVGWPCSGCVQSGHVMSVVISILFRGSLGHACLQFSCSQPRRKGRRERRRRGLRHRHRPACHPHRWEVRAGFGHRTSRLLAAELFEEHVSPRRLEWCVAGAEMQCQRPAPPVACVDWRVMPRQAMVEMDLHHR